MRNPHAGQAFTTPDEQIAEALLDVSIPTLMLSLVHMSGDAELIRGALKPAGLFLNEVQGYMSEEDKAAVRKIALEVIADYRDRGCPEPEPISAELLHEMMNWLVCEPVPDEYVPMLLEEMELDGRDARLVPPAGEADGFPVVVIGCGESGLLAGIRLKEAGIPFTIVEKNAGVGGTWYQNTYPGARVDVPNHFYCYSFEPTDEWTHFFAEQPELQAYFERVMDKHDIRRHVLWETEVTEASWDDDTATWTVRARDRSGTTTELSARAVITAVGQLDRAHTPTIEGQQDFAGPTFHSSAWDHSVDLDGKRVAMIGAGASGFQIAPTIAPDVEHLTVFQRTAQWMFPNPSYHDEVGPGVKWALKHLPFYGRWYRFLLFWPWCDKGLDVARVDPDYPDQQKAINEVSEVTRIMFTDWIISQVGDDPALRAKVVPDYPATGKRTLQDNGSWLKTLTRDNVELVRTGDRPHRTGRSRHRGRHASSGRRHRVRHRVRAHQAVVAHDHSRPQRRGPQRALGRTTVGLSGHHDSRLSELLLHERPRHLAGQRRQPDLPLRVSDALHHTMFGTAHRGRSHDDGTDCREDEGLARTQPGRDAHDGVVTAHDQALVFQEQPRRGAHPQPVAPRRLLELDPRTGSRRLRHPLDVSFQLMFFANVRASSEMVPSSWLRWMYC